MEIPKLNGIQTRERLVVICEVVLNSKTSVYDIFGNDTIKVGACILLFASVCDIPVFKQIKSKYRWKLNNNYMQYISFYKDRLPFKPKSNVVIYFDVMGIGRKLYYGIIDEYYDTIVREFRRGGLEFCFLPRVAHDMDLKKIYRYFNPQAGPYDYISNISLYEDRDLLEYIVADYDQQRLLPGLIQYMGDDFDKEDTYTFAYTPLDHFGSSPIELVKLYVEHHGIHINHFECMDLLGAAKSMEIEACEDEAPRSHGRFLRRESRSSEEIDVEMMMSEVQALVERLRQSGVGEIALQRLFKPTQQLSRIHIQYGRIFLPDYNNMEIKMHPLSKAIYLLYLRHPEGIMFSYLPDYRQELLHLYELISGRDSREDIRRSIDDVTDPTRNSINEKCSRIKQAFLREFDDSIARNYYITGERGEAKNILLPREMVTWDMPE